MSTRTPVLRRIMQMWDAVQVELHGQYSIQRLHAMRQYTESASFLQAVKVIALSLLPSLCLLIGIDALPVAPPEAGAYEQPTGFWIRTIYTNASLVVCFTIGVCHFEPSLPMSASRLSLITAVITVILMATFNIEIVTIGFPVPFVLQLQGIPFTDLLFLAWWLSWKEILRVNQETKKNVIRYLKHMMTNCTVFIIYIVYMHVYNALDGWGQLAFTVLLPVMKLILKNVVKSGVENQEDLAPLIVVSSIDLFHSFFLSMIMQNTGSSTMTLGLVAVADIGQSAFAIYDVRQFLARLDDLKSRMELSERGSQSDDLITSVGQILETNETVRQHPTVAKPRDVRDSARPRSRFRSLLRRLTTWLGHSTAVHPAMPTTSSSPTSHDTNSGPSETRPVDAALPVELLSESQLAQVEYTHTALQLLHMTEFHVLLEFVEVMMAAVNAAYVFAMSYMPNRVYYAKFAAMSITEQQAAAAQVAVYAVYELVSLVAFLWVLGYHIKGFSPLRQLAFALQAHWKLFQSMCLIWIHLIVQISFAHCGSDFTFQFKWLRRGHSNAST